MQRAKELIGMQETSRRTDLSGQQYFLGTPTTARNTVLPDHLQPVHEDMEVRLRVHIRLRSLRGT